MRQDRAGAWIARSTPGPPRARASSDGNLLFVGGDEDAIILSVPNLEPVAGLHKKLERGVFSPDGQTIVGLEKEGETVSLFRVASGAAVRSWNIGVVVLAASFAPDGKTIALGCADGRVRVINATTGATRRTFDHPNPVSGLSVSHDGRKLATIADHQITLWRLK